MASGIYIAPETSTDVVAFQWAAYLDGGSALITERDSNADKGRIAEIYAAVLKSLSEQTLMTPLTYQSETAL